MKTTALICEFNPLHRGHAHVLAEAKRDADCLVAIMSGNYVQRAEAAVFDKYTRAKAAVLAGADLVLELPYPWSSASAEYFASAGVFLASSLADTLAFGVATPCLILHQEIAHTLLSVEYASLYQAEENRDPTSGSAVLRERCLAALLQRDVAPILRSPNDILAVEYCKAIARSGSTLSLCPIERISSAGELPLKSATTLRQLLADGGMTALQAQLPPAVYPLFCDAYDAGRYVSGDALEEMEFLHMRRAALNMLSDVPECGGGIGDRLIGAAENVGSGAAMFAAAATKKYTNARFRRAALFALLPFEKDLLRQPPQYTVLLAASEKGRQCLRALRRSPKVPILTKAADGAILSDAAKKQYAVLCLADRLYTLLTNRRLSANYFLRQFPYIQ